MNMSRLCVCCVLALLAGRACADDIIDYIEALDKEFTRHVTENSVRISARPRLLERAFAAFVHERLDKKETRQAVFTAWRPVYETMRNDGYVFDLEYLLLNQNLDAGIEVPLQGDLRRHIFLINSKGETGMAYRITGDRIEQLDYVYPRCALTCYFNTCNERGVPLLRQGIMGLTIKIVQYSTVLPDVSFTWSVPLQYASLPRPQALQARFGATPFRTLMPYASNVYHRVALMPVATTNKMAAATSSPR